MLKKINSIEFVGQPRKDTTDNCQVIATCLSRLNHSLIFFYVEVTISMDSIDRSKAVNQLYVQVQMK